jgi:hypothetical protein
MPRMLLLLALFAGALALLATPVVAHESDSKSNDGVALGPLIFEPEEDWKEIQPHQQIPGVGRIVATAADPSRRGSS